jgi:hypothetical protein
MARSSGPRVLLEVLRSEGVIEHHRRKKNAHALSNLPSSRVVGGPTTRRSTAVPELQIIDVAAALRRWAKLSVTSDEELYAARFSGKRLLALWNALTDVEMGPESRRPGGLSHRDGP